MRRVREWLGQPERLTAREAEALTAGAYLVGWLLALAVDEWQRRRAEAAYWDRKFRQLAEDVRQSGADVFAEPVSGDKP